MCHESQNVKPQAERLISFHADGILAILDGRKTQTRRPVRPQPDPGAAAILADSVTYGRVALGVRCPFGQPGDLLQVVHGVGTCQRCGHGLYAGVSEDGSAWEFDQCKSCGCRWWHRQPKIPTFGPLPTICVTDVRVERVREISREDCYREGITVAARNTDPGSYLPVAWSAMKAGFSISWDSIYVAKGFGWCANPRVWVVTFEVVDQAAAISGDSQQLPDGIAWVCYRCGTPYPESVKRCDRHDDESGGAR